MGILYKYEFTLLYTAKIHIFVRESGPYRKGLIPYLEEIKIPYR